MQIKSKTNSSDRQDNNFLYQLLSCSVLSLQSVIFVQYGRKDLLYQCIKGDHSRRINVNRSDLLHFYVLFTNLLRRLFSRIQYWIETFSVIFPNKQQQGFTESLKCIATALTLSEAIYGLFSNFIVLYLLPFLTLCGPLIRLGMQDFLIN